VSWPLVKLKDCCQIVGGATPKREIPEFWEGGDIPWVTPKDISKATMAYLNDAPEFITDKGFKSCAAQMLPVGSLLLTSRAPIGNVAITKIEMCTNQGFKSLVPSAKVDILYLYYCMLYSSERLNACGNGATFKEVSKKVVEEFEIPLPPLSTQKQIAAILEKADQLRKDCQQMEQELNNLAQAVFIDMFGDPVSNPKGWETLPLSSIVDDFLGGKSLAASEDEATNFKNRVAKISAVTSGEFKSYESKPLPNDYEPPEAHYIKNGDLLFSRANTTELVGATAMVFNTPGNIVLPDKLWRFVWKADVELSSVFMWKLLSFPSQRIEISKLSSGSGGSMKNISKEKLSTLNVIFPPAHLQKKYEEFYSLLRRQIEEQKNNMGDADKLFYSLMQKAFSGELNLNHKAA